MTSFMPPQRLEPPRVHVSIIVVDTVKLTAVGIDVKNHGPVTIDLSIHNTQTVIYPREGEEWFLTKINEVWVLDKKAGFGNEGLLREARPGDMVTVTTGNYSLDSGPVSIIADTTVQGHLTANTNFTVWGNTDLGPLQMSGQLDLWDGDLHTHGNAIYMEGGYFDTSGGDIYTAGADIDTGGGKISTGGGQISGGNIFGAQIAATLDSFFSGNIQANSMHCLNTLTVASIQAFGTLAMHGSGIDLGNGNIANVGALGFNNYLTGPNYYASSGFHAGSSSMDGSGGFFPQCNGYNAAFGGVAIGGNAISTGGTRIDGGGFSGTGCMASNGGFGTLYYYLLVAPPSERRMKTEESLIRNGLDVIRALVPARWHWREQPSESDPNIDMPPDTATHAGVYVDEIADVAPELIVNHPEDESNSRPRTYEDRGLIAYLVAAVQEQQKQIEALTARLDALENKGGTP